jgi:hypothetical protein
MTDKSKYASAHEAARAVWAEEALKKKFASLLGHPAFGPEVHLFWAHLWATEAHRKAIRKAFAQSMPPEAAEEAYEGIAAAMEDDEVSGLFVALASQAMRDVLLDWVDKLGTHYAHLVDGDSSSEDTDTVKVIDEKRNDDLLFQEYEDGSSAIQMVVGDTLDNKEESEELMRKTVASYQKLLPELPPAFIRMGKVVMVFDPSTLSDKPPESLEDAIAVMDKVRKHLVKARDTMSSSSKTH